MIPRHLKRSLSIISQIRPTRTPMIKNTISRSYVYSFNKAKEARNLNSKTNNDNNKKKSFQAETFSEKAFQDIKNDIGHQMGKGMSIENIEKILDDLESEGKVHKSNYVSFMNWILGGCFIWILFMIRGNMVEKLEKQEEIEVLQEEIKYVNEDYTQRVKLMKELTKYCGIELAEEAFPETLKGNQQV